MSFDANILCPSLKVAASCGVHFSRPLQIKKMLKNKMSSSFSSFFFPFFFWKEGGDGFKGLIFLYFLGIQKGDVCCTSLWILVSDFQGNCLFTY